MLEEDWLRPHFSHLSTHKPLGFAGAFAPGGVRLRMLKEMASALASLEYCSNWDVPNEWEKANITHNLEKD